MQHDTVHMLDATQLAALEKQLSSIATRLSMSQLRPLPPGCVFELVVHSHDAQPPRAAQTTPGGDGEPLWLDAHPDQGSSRGERERERERENGPGGLTREGPFPSNSSPHDHMVLREDLVGSHGRWTRPRLQTGSVRHRGQNAGADSLR